MSYWPHFPESLSRIKQLFINNFFPMDFVPFISGQSLFMILGIEGHSTFYIYLLIFGIALFSNFFGTKVGEFFGLRLC